MDAEVRRIITEACKTTEELLLKNKDKLTLVCIIIVYKINVYFNTFNISNISIDFSSQKCTAC